MSSRFEFVFLDKSTAVFPDRWPLTAHETPFPTRPLALFAVIRHVDGTPAVDPAVKPGDDWTPAHFVRSATEDMGHDWKWMARDGGTLRYSGYNAGRWFAVQVG